MDDDNEVEGRGVSEGEAEVALEGGVEGEDETLAAAVDGLRERCEQGANVWLFECHPKKQPLAEGTPADEIEHWPATVYRDHIEPGDPAVFWVAGRDAGVRAIGQVVGPLFEEGETWQCPLDLYIDLFEVPIRKAELLADRRFVDAPIIRTPHAGSPHLLLGDHLAAILDLAVVPFWARRSSPMARRVASLIQEQVDEAASGFDDFPVIARANDGWAELLGVEPQEVREALNELFFLTREQALPDETLGFTFDTTRPPRPPRPEI